MTRELWENKPVWLTARLDQRLAMIEDKVFDIARAHGIHIIMTPLSEEPPGCSEKEAKRWNRTCDNCKVYVPDGPGFYTGQAEARKHKFLVLIPFGCCAACAGKVPA